MEITKKIFIKALLDAEEKEKVRLKSEDDVSWDFSDKFESSMEKLLRKNNRIKLSTRANVRRGLIAALIAMIIMFVGLMSVSATREAIITFIVNRGKHETEISLNEHYPDFYPERIERKYTVTDIPNGYTLDAYDRGEYHVMRVWKGTNGGELAFGQALLDASISFDNEHNYQELKINGYDAFYSEDDSGACLMWSDGEYWFTLNGSSDIKDYIKSGQNHLALDE